MKNFQYKNIGGIVDDYPQDLGEVSSVLSKFVEEGWTGIFLELMADGKPIFYLQRGQSEEQG